MKPSIEELRARLEARQPDAPEFYQRALDRLFGIDHEFKATPGPRGLQRVTMGAPYPPGVAFESLAEAYITATGDADLSHVDRIALIYSGPTFLNALADTLNKLLLKDYAPDYRWRDIVTSITSAPDFRALERVRVKYVADLPTVGADERYPEIVAKGDESLSYQVATKGANLTVTRRALLGNDVQDIERAVQQLGRAAWRTLAKAVWSKVISNDAYGVDGVPFFHGDHGNLGSGALSVANLTAAREAIFAQKEPGSDDRLGLSGPFLLVVPIELESTAIAINTAERIAATDDANPWRGRFGANNERIFANPLLEDASDWYLFDVGGGVEIIQVAFLMGRQSPELILGDSPSAGETFSQDRITYKMRHEWGATIADYRGAYKAVVP
jgi:hypothetical protein